MTVPAVSILHPVPFFAARALAQPDGLKPGDFVRQCLTYQAATADLWGFAVDGVLLGVMGLQPEADARATLFIWLGPPERARPWLPAMLRAARLTLRARAQNGGGQIRAEIRRGHRPGQRLAALAGLSFARDAGAFEIWGN